MPIRTIAFSLVLATSHVWADVDLPAVISDGMVLQREATVPIWGWGKSGDSVTVQFAKQSAEGVVKADGSWRVDLKPLVAASQTSPTTTSPSVTVSPPTVIVMDRLADDASSGLRPTRQLPSGFTTSSADCLANFTVTASPCLPHPQIGTVV